MVRVANSSFGALWKVFRTNSLARADRLKICITFLRDWPSVGLCLGLGMKGLISTFEKYYNYYQGIQNKCNISGPRASFWTAGPPSVPLSSFLTTGSPSVPLGPFLTAGPLPHRWTPFLTAGPLSWPLGPVIRIGFPSPPSHRRWSW